MLHNIIGPENIIIPLESSDRDECLAELLENLVAQQPQIKRKEALDALMQREEKMSTAVFKNIAVPHAVCESVQKSCVAIGISKKGIDFGSTVTNPEILKTHVIFEILFEEEDTSGHLAILKDILHLVENPDFISSLMSSSSSYEIYDIIKSNEV